MFLRVSVPAIHHFRNGEGKMEGPEFDKNPWMKWGWCSVDEILNCINMRFSDLGEDNRPGWWMEELFNRFPWSPVPPGLGDHQPLILMHTPITTEDGTVYGNGIMSLPQWKSKSERGRPYNVYVTAKWAERVIEVLENGGREVVILNVGVKGILVYSDTEGQCHEFCSRR